MAVARPLLVDQRVGLVAEDRTEIAVALLGVLGVEEHPVLMFAGDDVDQAALLVGHHVDHAFAFLGTSRLAFVVERHGHAEVDGLVRRRIVGHDVTAAIGGDLAGLFFLGRGIALLGANVDLAGRADEIAGVNLGLGGVAGRGQRQAHQLMRVQHDPHLLRRRVELNQIGIAAIGGAADVNPAVFALAEREIARLLGRGFRRNVIGLRPQIFHGGRRFLGYGS